MRINWPGAKPGVLAALGVALAALLAVPASADDADLVKQIKAAGREGAGNVRAAKAWKELVARGPDALPALLAGMDDEDATTSNWLRVGVDAVAGKALEAKVLDRAVLEKHIADRKQSGVGRRLAYEWLTRLDPGAPARLLPGMLQDPGAELRRDAVALVMDEGKQALAKKDEVAAKSAYQKALAAACDPDQVDDIAKALEGLMVKVDRAAHMGFILRWHLVSPFDSKGGKGFSVAYPPEKGVKLGATYQSRDGKPIQWVAHASKDPQGMVDLNKAQDKHKGAVAYAFAEVTSPEERAVQVRVGCITAFKVFLNGKEVFAQEEYHHGMRVDQYVARGTLKKGRNEILFKVCQNEQKEAWAQNWQFQARICDAVGAAVPFTQPAGKNVAQRAEVSR